MNANMRILFFQNHHHLNYWFIKIHEYLKKVYPDLIWDFERNRIIRFGTQVWIFMVYEDGRIIGHSRRGWPTYINTEYLLEHNFEQTMIDILKGERQWKTLM